MLCIAYTVSHMLSTSNSLATCGTFFCLLIFFVNKLDPHQAQKKGQDSDQKHCFLQTVNSEDVQATKKHAKLTPTYKVLMLSDDFIYPEDHN